MPRFVLLLHECPSDRPRPTHCDLMLEVGDVLETWAIDELPRDWTAFVNDLNLGDSNIVAVERLADHRLAYLDYEGPVSGDRGSVRRLDAGTLTAIPNSHRYTITGKQIRGTIEIRQSEADPTQWQLEVTAAT